MAASFEEALAAARQQTPPQIWDAMSARERCAAIYREMRRIDAEEAAGEPREPEAKK